MTVSYSAKVATANFGRFFKLLKRWRGSIYKILFKEFAVFAAAYFLIGFIYRFALPDNQKRYFEQVAEYCAKFNDLIPVVFVLGFYVNHVANLWWDKFRTLPWPGTTSMLVSAHMHGHDERGRLMRRTIMRYVCLSYVITMSSISPPVNKRFPTLQHMADAGLILPNEAMILTNLKTPYNKFFVPLVWASALVTRARKEGRIKDDYAVNNLIKELNDFRLKEFDLLNYNWISLPLVYTQVVTIAVHTFFGTCLLARQRLDNGMVGDFYFPIFTFLQFLFYMGWLKVAETMLNPFGEDDDDFDINYLIDRHLQISYLVVDEMHNEHPELIRDQYWDTADFEMPYTEESERYHNTEEKQAGAADIEIPLFIAGCPTATNSLTCIYEEGGEEEKGGNLLSNLPPHSLQSRDGRFVPARSSQHRNHHHHHMSKSPGVWKSIKRSISRQNSTASIRRGSLPTDRKFAKRMISHESTQSGSSHPPATSRFPSITVSHVPSVDSENMSMERFPSTTASHVPRVDSENMSMERFPSTTVNRVPRVDSENMSMERLHSPVYIQGDYQMEELMFHMSDVESEDGHDANCSKAKVISGPIEVNRNNNNNGVNKPTSRSASGGSETESLFGFDPADAKQRNKSFRIHHDNAQVFTDCDRPNVDNLSLIVEGSPEVAKQQIEPSRSHQPTTVSPARSAHSADTAAVSAGTAAGVLSQPSSDGNSLMDKIKENLKLMRKESLTSQHSTSSVNTDIR